MQTVASLPSLAAEAMTEMRVAWMECIGRAALAGTEISQQIVRHAAEQQQQLAADALQGWMDRNARIMRLTLDMTQEGFRPFLGRLTAGRYESRTGQ